MGTTTTHGEIPDHRWRIVPSVGSGSAFLVGASCDGAFHFCRALLRGSPGGRGLAHAAGWWVAHFGARCAFENAASLARQKDDPWNAVAATAATWALLDARRGARAAARSAVLEAACAALLEGALIAFERVFVTTQPRPPAPVPQPPRRSPTPPAGHAPTPGGLPGDPAPAHCGPRDPRR